MEERREEKIRVPESVVPGLRRRGKVTVNAG